MEEGRQGLATSRGEDKAGPTLAVVIILGKCSVSKAGLREGAPHAGVHRGRSPLGIPVGGEQGPRSEDEEEQGLVPGQHNVLHCAVHGAHLLGGGGQEGQRPDALLHTRVAQVPTLVLLPVALQGGVKGRSGGGQLEDKCFPPRSVTPLHQTLMLSDLLCGPEVTPPPAKHPGWTLLYQVPRAY